MIRARVRRASGRSLIELMVAMAIGLGMSMAVSSLYIASRGTARTGDAAMEVRANGRLAIQLLSEQLRMAGYGDYISASKGSRFKGSPRTGTSAAGIGFAVNGCDGRFVDNTDATRGCGTSTGPASVAIAYHANASSAATGADVDCIGDAALDVSGIPMVLNTYYVATSTGAANDSSDDISTLYCRGGSSSSSQPLVPGVEQFVVRYGIDTNSDFSVDLLLTASQIRSQMALAPPLYDFSNVESVEVCLVLRSTNKTPVASGSTARDCNNAAFANDGYYRQRFMTTVALRNKVYLP